MEHRHAPLRREPVLQLGAGNGEYIAADGYAIARYAEAAERIAAHSLVAAGTEQQVFRHFVDAGTEDLAELRAGDRSPALRQRTQPDAVEVDARDLRLVQCAADASR